MVEIKAYRWSPIIQQDDGGGVGKPLSLKKVLTSFSGVSGSAGMQAVAEGADEHWNTEQFDTRDETQ